ncbi:MAG TPA: urease accessory protein UreD [Candidatus Didemnitutus sp.]|nr:urease accessory protein UreD [Candidatus Didemnitutus sp.]
MPELSGHLRLTAAVNGHGQTALAMQSFRAPFHLSKPYWDVDASVLIAQVVNPTAGILAGDRLQSDIAVGEGATLLVTTPSASRVFQMNGGAAESQQHFAVGRGGWLEVTPEPLVPHRGSRYRQVTTIEVEPGGAMFFVDQLQPGRVGHDEAWQWDRLCLELDVRCGGDLVLRERLDQSGEELRALAELAGSGPAACFANAVLIGTTTSDAWIAELKLLHRDGLWVGVSALRAGGWSLRLVAPDSVRLRQGLKDARRILATQFPRLAADLRKL